MQINILKTFNDESKKQEYVNEKIESLAQLMHRKPAVLFTGAGFSYKMENLEGTSPKTVDKLTEKLLGEHIEDLNLKEIVDLYIQTNQSESIVDILQSEYRIKTVQSFHKNIAKINWRRCYTTNYDLGLEMSFTEIGKVLRKINPISASDLYQKGDICVHVNGDIDILSSTTLNSSFRLSELSYMTNNFEDTYWQKLLDMDFEGSSAIVFIGYSMYDDNIKKAITKYKEKVFIVTSPIATKAEILKLSSYGHVLPIGVEAFSNSLTEKLDTLSSQQGDIHLQTLIPINISDTSFESGINDKLKVYSNQVLRDFILFGTINNDLIIQDYINYNRDHIGVFCHRDPSLLRIAESLEEGKNVIVTSEIGNGKTTLLQQLKAYLSLHTSFSIYEINGDDISQGDFNYDLDILRNLNHNTVIICDDINKFTELFLLINLINSNNLKVVGSVRSIDLDTLKIIPNSNGPNDYGSQTRLINIDTLDSDSEVDEFVTIIKQLNYWGELITSSDERKVKYIKDEYTSQISEILLGLFSSTQIIQEVQDIFAPLFTVKEYKDTIFVIALFQYLNIDIKPFLISYFSESDAINSPNYLENKTTKMLYLNNGYSNKSSLFCRSLLKNHFNSTMFKVPMLLKIIRLFEAEKKKNPAEKDIDVLGLKDTLIKQILRFSNVDNILEEKGKKYALESYYREAIMCAKYLERSPHYWLQLSMAKIANHDFLGAEKALESADKTAAHKTVEYRYAIETQRARLLIKQALECHDGHQGWSLFEQAHRCLIPVTNDRFKFRQVSEYFTFYEKYYYSKLPNKFKPHFIDACREMLVAVKKVDEEEAGDPSVIHCSNRLDRILTTVDK